MPFDGIVTKAVTEDLQATLTDGRINKIYQPTNTELLITVRNNRKNFTLLLSVHPSYSRFHLTEEKFQNPEQPPMFCMHMRKYLNGGFIREITQDGLERIVTFKIQTWDELGITNFHYLVAEIMGRHSNIILLDPNQEKIIDSMKHIPPFQNRYRTVLPGHEYVYPPSQNKYNPLEITEDEFYQRIDFNAGKIDRQIVQTVDGFSPFIAREVTKRAQLGNRKKYWKHFLDIRNEIKEKQYVPTIYQNEREDFHVISLQKHTGERNSFANIHDMLDTFFSGKAERDRVQQQTRDLRRFIENELKKNERKLTIHHRTLENAKDAQKYQRYGELLTAHSSDEKSIRIMTNIVGGKTPEENDLFIEEIERLTGIKVDMVKPPSDYNQKLLTSLSSGDKFDLVLVTKELMDRLVDQEVLTVLNDEIENSDILSDPTVIPEEEWDLIKYDEEIYGVFNKFEGGTMPVVRQDWMDKLGLEDPETLDDFYEIFKAFKEQDPNESGKDDTYGLTTAGLYDIQPFLSAAGVKYKYVIDEDGNRTIPIATEKSVPVLE